MARGVKKTDIPDELKNNIIADIQSGKTKKSIAIDRNTSYFMIQRVIRENPDAFAETSEETSD